MRFRTYAEMAAAGRGRYYEGYDFIRGKRYARGDHYVVYEDGLVQLTDTFARDTSRDVALRHVGMAVCTPDELPTADYQFTTRDGQSLCKADLAGAGMLLLDFAHNMCVALQGDSQRGPADTDVHYTARWYYNGASVPVPRHPVRYAILDRAVAAQIRRAARKIGDIACGMARVMGAAHSHHWFTPQSQRDAAAELVASIPLGAEQAQFQACLDKLMQGDRYASSDADRLLRALHLLSEAPATAAFTKLVRERSRTKQTTPWLRIERVRA